MTTMNISLPEGLKAFVDEQVAARGYGSASEYVRDLIRRDEDVQKFRALIQEGLESPARTPSPTRRSSRTCGPRIRARPRARVTIKPAVLRARAEADIDAIVDGYLAEAGGQSRSPSPPRSTGRSGTSKANPATGSLRYGDQSGLPGLRFWPIRRFPHLVFYVEQADRVDVLRVLHGSRDIPAALRSPRRGASRGPRRTG